MLSVRSPSARLRRPRRLIGARRRMWIESLESRRLLAVLQAVSPSANAQHQLATTSVDLTFDASIDAASVSDQSVVVHASQSGRRQVPPDSLVTAANVVQHAPNAPYHAGETVEVTATAAITDLDGAGLVNPTVTQFRVGVTTGDGSLSDSGQRVGAPRSWTSALGDVDGDGDLDAFVGVSNDPDVVLLNDGVGNFVDSGQLIGDQTTNAIELGDLDGDGDLDAVVGTSLSAEIRINDGSGVFSNQTLTGASVTNAVALGDIDADGDLDFVQSRSYQGGGRIWRNNGSGSFAISQHSLGLSNAVAIELADLDGDGDLDLFQARSTTSQVWLNDGSGSFTDHPQTLSHLNDPRSIDLGDIDGDGDIDVFFGTTAANQILINDGSANFTDSGQSIGSSQTQFSRLGDLDADGDLDLVWEDGSPFGVAPIKIFVNDGSGNFTDSGLSPGSVDLRSQAQLGDLDGDGDLDAFLQSYDSTASNQVWLNSGEPSLTGSISGTLFNDIDANGVRDVGEPTLAGWTVFLDDNANGILDTGETARSTNASGQYVFSLLAPGDYRVDVLESPGWQLTAPPAGHQQVTVAASQVASGYDFGLVSSLGGVSGTIWDDTNGDGVRDAGEAGLEGRSVFADFNSNGVLDAGEPSTASDSAGDYLLTDVPAGATRIHSQLPTGWEQTFPVSSAFHDVTVIANQVNAGFEFGHRLLPAGGLSGAKWNDVNENGIRDAGEAGLEGWKIFLDLNINGIADSDEPFQITDADGNYQFNSLPVGQYVVGEVRQFAWAQSYPQPPQTASALSVPAVLPLQVTDSWAPVYPTSIAVSESDQLLTDIAADELLAESNSLAPATAESSQLIDLDVLRTDPPFQEIDGRGYATVIIDTGIDLDHPAFGPDADSDGVADRIVYHYDFSDDDDDASDVDGHGSHVASIVASSAGSYTGVAPGANIIALKVFPEEGGGNFSDVEQALQWVVSHASQYNVVSVNMSLGDTNNHMSAQSLYGLGDELSALAMLGVIVVSSAGNSFHAHGSVPGVGYPAADFNSLSIGAVYDASVGGVSYASGAEAFSSGPDRITPFSQRHQTLMDVLAPGAAIRGADEAGGSSVRHGTSQASPHVAGMAVLAQQIADQNLGRRLTPAEFQALLISSAVIVNDGDDEDDNVTNTGLDFPRLDAHALARAILEIGNTGAPGTHTVNVAADQVTIDVDFGNYRTLGEINGSVWDDANDDGILGAEDQPLADWEVYLDLNRSGTRDGNDLVTLTDQQGQYHFDGLAPGDYAVRIVLPPSWQSIDPASGETIVSMPTPAVVTGVAFLAALPSGALGGSVWEDINADGIQDAGDLPIAGRRVFLDSNGDGEFQIGQIEPDDYITGTLMNDVVDGVTLTTIGVASLAADGSVRNFAPPIAAPNASTGIHIFASARSVLWNADTLSLKIEFDSPVSDVSIDMVSDDALDIGRLRAYDASDNLLEEFISSAVAMPGFATMSISRPTADIAYAIAGGYESHTVRLDHLQFGHREEWTLSDSSGNYQFENLLEVQYDVHQQLPSGWVQTFPGTEGHSVNVLSNQTADADFGSYPLPGNLAGTKTADLDGDGQFDPGEPPLADWQIYLDLDDNGQWDGGEPITTTDALGRYEFSNISSGNYVIAEVPQPGWIQSSPGARHDVVYDNTTYTIGSFSSTGLPSGDEIRLTSAGTLVELGVGISTQWNGGTADIQVWLYENDGPSGMPGTLLWDSGLMTGLSLPVENALLTLELPGIEVPEVVTWLTQISNAEPVAIGRPIYGPATIGQSTDNSWFGNHPSYANTNNSIMGRAVIDTGKRGQHVIQLAAGQTIEQLDFSSTLDMDFGDAPNTYGTTFTAGGPYHVPQGDLILGGLRDAESNGLPGTNAEGDDQTGQSDEEGVLWPQALMPGQSTELTVNVGDPGELAFWIDYDRDGIWQPAERATISLASAGMHQIPITIPADALPGPSYARFRVSTDAEAISSPGGPAPDGEVEDYLISIAGPPTDLTIDQPSINENASADAADLLFGHLEAIDPNQIQEVHTFDLVSGSGDTDNHRFLISENQLWLKAGEVVDYETQSTYFTRLRVTDSTGLMFEKPLVLSVNDLVEVNDDDVVLADGGDQRSRMDRVEISFDSEVTIESDAFEVRRLESDELVDVAFVTSLEQGRTIATLSFGGIHTNQGFLHNGNYQLRIDGTKVSNSAGFNLDANADGSAGDAYFFGDQQVDDFFVLYGDGDGSEKVDLVDFAGFRIGYGLSLGESEYTPEYDWDANDQIDLVDFAAFRAGYANIRAWP